ncbi:MAG: AMP phosphorylase [Candidatus Aenigmarchaeota archaeon]|nr:AMP phosphorylase [Candidatus Aenigmarchaeota archaeon]
MLLIARPLQFEANKPIIVLRKEDADELGVKALERVEIKFDGRKTVAIVNVARKVIGKGEAGMYASLFDQLRLKAGQPVDVSPAEPPSSIDSIKRKMAGKPLSKDEMRAIVEDVVGERLSDVETAAFVIALNDHGLSMGEATALSTAMAETGEKLRLGKKDVYDKHSAGGIPGDKTSMLLVPIVAAAGLTIPKTSSRAITAPAGTADKMECIAPVEHSMEEIARIVRKTNGCLVWGGAVDMAPADDAFIRVEYPLSIDPLLLPSVMSKKKAAGAKYLAIDIPTGKGAKIKTVGEAQELAKQFIELGRNLGIRVSCTSTYGEQPLGYGVGPALEAREVLETLYAHRGSADLVAKACHLSGVLFGFKGMKNGEAYARRLLSSGRALAKMKQIIAEQGGDPSIKPSDIHVGGQRMKVESDASGHVWWINNSTITQIARAAGCPSDKGAGVLLRKKIGDRVAKGDVLFEIYADKTQKLNRALKVAEDSDVMGVGDISNMVMLTLPEEREHRRHFIMER